MVYADLIAAVLLSFVVERVLAVVFDISGLGEKVKLGGAWVDRTAPSFRGASFKGVIAAAIAIAIAIAGDLNIIDEIITNATGQADTGIPSLLGQILTGVFIAGGSQGSVKLFQDVLGFSKANRDVIRRSSEAAAKAREEKGKRDQIAAKLERTRIENALAAAENDEKLAAFRADTDKKVMEIEGRKRLEDARKSAGVSVDPKYLSRPSDPYLRDVIANWDEFVALRAELLADAG